MSYAEPVYLPHDGGLIGLRDDQAARLEPADLAAISAFLVVVPGEAVVIADAALPPVRQASRRYQAARFALEDQLAGAIDTLHIALAPRPFDGSYPAAIVDQEQMEAWLATFGDDRKRVTAGMVPDYFCLAVPRADTATLWLFADRALYRRDPWHGFACEWSLLPAMLPAASTPAHLDVRVAAEANAEDLLERLRGHGFEINVADRPTEQTLRSELLAAAPARPVIDLLQHRYAPVSAMNEWWLPVRATAVLALVWLGLAVTTQALYLNQLGASHERLRSQVESRFREAFPNVEAANNIRIQAEEQIRALRAQQGTEGLFPLLATMAEATAGISGLGMDSLQYRNGELFLSLRGDNVQTLEQLRSSFAENDRAKLEIQSADASSDGVDIRARVSSRDS